MRPLSFLIKPFLLAIPILAAAPPLAYSTVILQQENEVAGTHKESSEELSQRTSEEDVKVQGELDQEETGYIWRKAPYYPSDQDLSLFYPPGSRRPLWGY